MKVYDDIMCNQLINPLTEQPDFVYSIELVGLLSLMGGSWVDDQTVEIWV